MDLIIVIFLIFDIKLNVNMNYMGHVLIKLWRLITFEPITRLICSIHHTVRLIDLSKNNYKARLADNRFKSYGPPKFIRSLSGIPHINVMTLRYMDRTLYHTISFLK